MGEAPLGGGFWRKLLKDLMTEFGWYAPVPATRATAGSAYGARCKPLKRDIFDRVYTGKRRILRLSSAWEAYDVLGIWWQRRGSNPR